MNNTINLFGAWTLTGPDSSGRETSVAASVPGCVHTDLISAGVVGDIFYRDNSLSVQWIERGNYTYTKKFTVDEPLPSAFLELDGVDTYAEVYLNSTRLGECDDMFTPYEFSVDGVLRGGENTLEVRFSSPISRVEGMPLREGAFTRERMNTRRIQCTYGWDWVDRFVTMGIYRPVRIVFRSKNEIGDLYAVTKDINPYSAQLKLTVGFRDFERNGDKVKIVLRSPTGEVVYERERVIIEPRLSQYIDVTDPLLWYPAGYGDQPLYTLTVTTPTSEKVEKIGIRRVTVLEITDKEGSPERERALALKKEEYLKDCDFNETTSGFTVLVNGVRIMCKGANWVPCEPFPSAETPEKITRLLELAVHGGMNMLRVWGGGIFEQDAFYSECDRLGILVSQDFLMACGKYPEEEEWFIEALEREAKSAALRLRNHPCLVFWSGDNENAVRGNENRTDFMGYRSAAYGISPILEALDPERYFFPSSPYGGDCFASATRGTTHNTFYLGKIFRYLDESDMRDYRCFFGKFVSRFCAEQAAFGMSFVSSLRKFLTDEDIFGEDTSMLEFHTKTNPSLKKTLFAYTDMMARKIFGDYADGADRIRKHMMLHCEWTRIGFELYRRHKGFSSGIIFWMFNDCWPSASGWSFLDYYACPKPAYYTFARCAKPVVALISEEDGKLLLHVSNDSTSAVSGTLELYLYDFKNDSRIFERSIDFTVRADKTETFFECDYEQFSRLMTEETVLLCDLKCDTGTDRAMFIPERYRDLSLPEYSVRVLAEDDESITVTADGFTPYAIIDSEYLLSDNCFALKRGETKRLTKILRL